MNPITPDDVLDEMRATRAVLNSAPDIVHDAELAADRAHDASQAAFDAALREAEGTIPMKEAIAREKSAAQRDAAFVAKAAHNWAKNRMKAAEAALVNLSAELKHMREDGA